MQGAITVEDLGSVGDGCKVDTEAIQDAVNAPRLFNTAASSISAAETLSTWTVFVGNGPDAGHPQQP